MASDPVAPKTPVEQRRHARRAADRWGRRVERAMMALLVGLYLIGFSADNNRDEERVKGFGAAVLINCVKTEQVKTTIRGVLRESIATLKQSRINIPGYGEQERLEAIERLRGDIKRFLPDNCRALEAVRIAVAEGLDAEQVEAEVRRLRERDVRRDAR